MNRPASSRSRRSRSFTSCFTRGFWRLVIFSGGGPTEHTEYTERRLSNFLLPVPAVCSVCPVGKKKYNDQPFPYHHEMELEIATLTNLGVGLGRVPLPAIRGQMTEDGGQGADPQVSAPSGA